jgi:signal transduction histidine kinase
MATKVNTYCYRLPDFYIQEVAEVNFIKFENINEVKDLLISERNLIFTLYLSDENLLSLISRLKTDYPFSSIIIVSSEISPNIVTKAIKAGADYYCDDSDARSYKAFIEDSLSEMSDDENIATWKYVLDKLPIFTFIKDAKEKKYLYINPIAEAVTEYSSANVINKKHFDFKELASIRIEESDDIVVTLKRAYTLHNIEIEKSNGNKITVNLTKFPILDKHNNVRYILGYVEEAKKYVDEINFMKTKFISIVSHEFRTPLTTIMLSSDLLRRYSAAWTNEEKNKHFDRIKNTVLSMTKMIENILNISKFDEGNFTLHKEQIDLASFCKAQAENIEFSTNFTSEINFNFIGDSNNIFLDETLVGLIITNLLSNAVKYNKNSQPIDFKVLRGEHTIIIEIEDRGLGIPKDDQEKLFDLFHRASNVGSIGGYGLGLALVKQCVELHKGSIKFTSKENLGTTFLVIIPI